MEKGNPPERVELNQKKEEDEGGLDWFKIKETSEVSPEPMDSNELLTSKCSSGGDAAGDNFCRDRVFKAASQGDQTQLQGLLHYLQTNNKTLTSPDFIDEANGKTALLKALLNLKEGRNDTVEFLLDVAENTGDLEKLINASYTDPRYRGELPLSLAACTNQPKVVEFLLENPHNRADPTLTDSQGNTVLHALIVIADNTPENTDMITRMYDNILIQHHKLQEKGSVQLEEIENNQGLTPLKLAAKLGRIGLFRHMLNREFEDEETRNLSRKFTEWVYGPVHSSLYDMRSIDTDQSGSVLEIIVFGTEIPNRPEMLEVEPLRSLLQNKWETFASKLFLINFLAYLMWLSIFTTVAFYRKSGQPPFPVEELPLDLLRLAGELISVLGAARFLYKTISIFRRNPPNLKSLFTDGFSEILFLLQAFLLLGAAGLYCAGFREYVVLLVLSLALAWVNVLYYSRGSRQLGIYNVMMQRMILGDLLHFLCVYSVLLLGFSAAVVTLIDESPATNRTLPRGRSFNVETFRCERPGYHDMGFTTLELFKFTIGMGDLEFTDQVQYREVFYILLLCYILLTYILMLNMLIALMGNTVERISSQSQPLWNLQRAFTILDMERSLPVCLRRRLQAYMSEMECFRTDLEKGRTFVRVTELNWRRWRSDLGMKLEEDPTNVQTKAGGRPENAGTQWNVHRLMERIRSRGQRPQDNII
ncbi:transient receptor potential cation channel subfamily V member 1-like isoform 2-T3 [Menidia menidia]